MLSLSAQNPSPDVLKQVLTKRLLALKPDGMTERQVLFQEVRAGTATGGEYPFQVTAAIRDYGPGYPANRYYGQTCVGHFDKVRFALHRDEFGEWTVEGAMTPPLATRECKPNPSAGVSSIPVSALAGTPAPAGSPAAAPVTPQASGVSMGSYECWGNGSARMLLNFSIRSASQYTGSDGKPGSYSYDPSSGRISFRGGALDGVMPQGFYAIYHQPNGVPTVSFRSPGGSEASFCQRAR